MILRAGSQGSGRHGCIGMSRALRAAVIVAVLGLLTPPATGEAKSQPTVPAAGHVQAALLTSQAGHQAPNRTLKPLHTPHPDALKAAKQRAAAAAPHAAATGQPQTSAPSTSSIFNGLDNPGLQASDEGNAATPPDSTGAIGPNNYVEMVNNLVGVYDRNTLTLQSSTGFAGFAHVPAGLGTSDPQIEWDPVANRWLYAMVGIATGNNYLLFGWTKTADPSNLTGGWCTFGVFTGSDLQDYPKLGHDANWVIVGANAYSDVNSSFKFETAQIWAIPKPAASDSTCSSPVSATFFADAKHPLKNADGTLAFTPVPANTTDTGNDYIVGSRDVSVSTASKLMVWHMEARPAPTLVPDGDITVGTYGVPPSVPQPGTSYLIDSLDGRNTQAVARFDPSSGAEALWTQHTIVGPSGTAAVRWYELLPAVLTIRQEGLLSSATDYYWNAAISPSAAGNEAMIEYNRGSATQLSLIGAQTRSSSTPLSQMDAGETLLGTSSAPDQENAFQTNCSPNPCRWGDYSGATPDLSNSHVVWGSNQIDGPVFLGYAQWQTQNFAISTVPPPPDFSLSASPTSQSVIQGSSTTYTINVAPVAGFNGSVNLSVSGLPVGAGGTFSPNPVTAASSTLTVTTASTTATGSYSLTITGTSGSLSHTTAATLIVTPPPPPDFSLSASPGSQTIVQGATTTYTTTITRISGFGDAVSLAVTGLPSGASGVFSPNPATGNTSTLTVTSAASTPQGTYALALTGTSGSLTHTTGATLVVSPPPPCSSAGLTPPTATQADGSTVHFAASSSGCASPQYEYWVQLLDGSWTLGRAFSSDPTWDWNTAGLGTGVYSVHVWANQAGDQTSSPEAWAGSSVTLTGCTSAGLSPSSTSVAAGSTVHFTASASGCASPQYEYWVQYTDAVWHMLRGFSTDPTWDWNTAGLVQGVYNVHVWANNAGDATSSPEAWAGSSVTLTVSGCTSATLSPSSATVSVGSTVHFIASSSGCANPQYEYWVQYTDASWHMLRAFSTDPTWDWNTAGLAVGAYNIHVWANNVGDQTSSAEAWAGSTVTLTGGCASASLAPASTSVTAGSIVHFTAGSTGCASPQYEYWVQYTDTTWHMLRAFSTDPTWDWNTTGLALGVYAVHVWANNAGDPTSSPEAWAGSTVTLSGGCTSASLAPASPTQEVGSTVNFTAGASGCAGPLFEYWVQYLDGSWHMLRAYSSDPTFAWNTSGFAPGAYAVHVWAIQNGESTSTLDAFGSSTVKLTGCTSASVTASSSTATGGASVTFTASGSGCSAPVYEFWLQDPVGTWHLMQAFSSANTWTWNTSGWATGTYNMHVWVNQQGADTGSPESWAGATVTVS